MAANNLLRFQKIVAHRNTFYQIMLSDNIYEVILHLPYWSHNVESCNKIFIMYI
jgi:hypothetical protein